MIVRKHARSDSRISATSIRLPCTKCGGSGVIEAFGYIGSGRCFTCKGFGFIEKKQAAIHEETVDRDRKRMELGAQIAMFAMKDRHVQACQ